MEKYKRSLGIVGLVTATIGLVGTFSYLKFKNAGEPTEINQKPPIVRKVKKEKLSTQHMTAEEYLAKDPRITEREIVSYWQNIGGILLRRFVTHEGGLYGPSRYERDFSNVTDNIYLKTGDEEKAREILEQHRKILNKDANWVEGQISHGKYLEEKLAEIDATKPRRQVVKFKEPIPYTKEVDEAIKFNLEKCFGYEPIVKEENLVEIRTWLRLTGCSGPIDTENFETNVKKYLKKNK